MGEFGKIVVERRGDGYAVVAAEDDAAPAGFELEGILVGICPQRLDDKGAGPSGNDPLYQLTGGAEIGLGEASTRNEEKERSKKMAHSNIIYKKIPGLRM
jgi:hypothetical protein